MNPLIPLLLSFWPWAADPSALADPPDTEAEVRRVCLPSSEAVDAYRECDRRIDWLHDVLWMGRHERYGVPEEYRRLDTELADLEWRHDVFVEMYLADAPAVNRLGHLKRLRELVGPERYKAGLSAMPMPPPAPPKPEPGEGP